MNRSEMKSWLAILALVSAGEGVLLAGGLEACFGIAQYTLIMELGALGGLGIGILVWLARGVWQRAGAARKHLGPLVLASAVPGLAVFAIAFAWRIMPLIREELKYNL